jgi:diacylglycerol kinase (ATP)
MYCDTLVLVNRKARSGAIDLQPVVELLVARGKRPSILPVNGRDDVGYGLDRNLSGPAPCVVIAGGDGTVNSSLAALLNCGYPFGILPLGTANDLARTLGLPLDPLDAAEVIARGRRRRIDVGRVNGCYFVNAAGIGFSSDLQRDLDVTTKKAFGPLSYPLAVARRWRRQQPFTVDVRGSLDGHHRVIQVTVANGRHYGGGMTAREDAAIDDGKLDLLLVEAQPLWKHLLHVSSLKTGVYDFASPFLVGRATELRLTTRRRKSISTDGENTTETPASFEVLPRALEVFVP